MTISHQRRTRLKYHKLYKNPKFIKLSIRNMQCLIMLGSMATSGAASPSTRIISSSTLPWKTLRTFRSFKGQVTVKILSLEASEVQCYCWDSRYPRCQFYWDPSHGWHWKSKERGCGSIFAIQSGKQQDLEKIQRKTKAVKSRSQGNSFYDIYCWWLEWERS